MSYSGMPHKYRGPARAAASPAIPKAKLGVKHTSKRARLLNKLLRISIDTAGAWLVQEKAKTAYLGRRITPLKTEAGGERTHPKQGRRTASGERRKPAGSTLPHSKVNLPEEVLESDFSSNSIHESRDISMPVELHFKRTSGRRSKIMETSMKMWPRQTWSFMNSGKAPQSTNPSNRNRLSSPIYDLMQKVWYSTCGFNRSGVYWPWFEMEKNEDLYTAATRQDLMASQNYGLGTGPALYDLVHYLNGDNATEGLEPFMIPDGDQNLLLPIRELKKVYHIRNSNSQLPLYCSIYICAPRRDQRRTNSPQRDWWDPYMAGVAASGFPNVNSLTTMLQDKNYSYTPQMDSANQPPTATNTYYNVTSATEVVPQSTPYLSEQFKERWEVLDVKSIRLLPEQYASLTLEQIFNNPMNLKRVMPSTIKAAATGALYPYKDHNCFFEGISLVPMIKFWGEEVTALDKSDAATAVQTSKMQRGRVGSGPGVLRVDIVKDEVVWHAPSTRLRDTNPGYVSPIKNWMDQPGFIAVQRGIPGTDVLQNVDYANINSFGLLQNEPKRYNAVTNVWDTINPAEFENFLIEISSRTEKRALEPSVAPNVP